VFLVDENSAKLEQFDPNRFSAILRY